jgi:protein-S-isoprenylcysteine O-methyltransferase Ste14
MRRSLFFAYGIACYVLFFITYACLACFVGNLFLPRTIDSGPATSPAWAVVIDVVLLLVFALQHSVMARPAFKVHWTRLVPIAIERSTYMLASCLALFALTWLWRPVNMLIWNVTDPIGWWIGTSLFATGWILVPLVSMALNHFDLFGVRQVWLHLTGEPYAPLAFRTPLPYSLVRHPLYVGWAIAFWATPAMTVGHLLFAAMLTGYMVVAACIEERDLIAHFGSEYEEYRRRVPMFVPIFSYMRRSSQIPLNPKGVS